MDIKIITKIEDKLLKAVSNIANNLPITHENYENNANKILSIKLRYVNIEEVKYETYVAVIERKYINSAYRKLDIETYNNLIKLTDEELDIKINEIAKYWMNSMKVLCMTHYLIKEDDDLPSVEMIKMLLNVKYPNGEVIDAIPDPDDKIKFFLLHGSID